MPTASAATLARVDDWLGEQPGDLRGALDAARAALDAAFPGAKLAIKWGYPTWVGNGNVAALMAHADHANLQLFRGAELPDPSGLLEGTGKGMRHVKLRHAKDLKVPAVKALLRAAWRLDQGGA